MSEHGSKGVYFLANDAVYDLTVTFLNSARDHFDVPLCLIPFDAQCDRLYLLAKTYGFLIFDDQRTLQRCDELSTHFHDSVVGHYRKLAAWEGPFASFIYVDVDTVFNANVSFVFDFLWDFDLIFSQSGFAGAHQWVWQDSIFHTDLLLPHQIEFSANTGFICSRSHVFTLDILEQRLADAVNLRPHMQLLCFEQPFLNYLTVTSNKRYTSLQELALSGMHANMPFELWAGTPGATVAGGTITMPDQPPILFVHWSGNWQQKQMRITPPADVPRPGEMPYEELWAHYRNAKEVLVEKENDASPDHSRWLLPDQSSLEDGAV